jgi:hypothetical protein
MRGWVRDPVREWLREWGPAARDPIATAPGTLAGAANDAAAAAGEGPAPAQFMQQALHICNTPAPQMGTYSRASGCGCIRVFPRLV